MTRQEKQSHLRWVTVADLRVAPGVSQRLEFRADWVQKHVNDFDPEKLGRITVNIRTDGHPYLMDGWHRTELMKAVGWADQQIQADTYQGLSEAEEGDLFLALNDRQAVTALDKFFVRCTTGDPVAQDIKRIVQGQGLKLGRAAGLRTIVGVSSVEKLYRGAGVAGESPKVLVDALKILRESWGDDGQNFQGLLIHGLGLMLLEHRDVKVPDLLDKLQAYPGGAPAVRAKAVHRRSILGGTSARNVAETFMDIYLARKGKK